MYKIMRIPEKGKVATPVDMNASFDGDPFKIDFSWGFSVCASVTDTSPADGETFVSGVLEVQTLTFESWANTDNSDYIQVWDSAGLSYAIALGKPLWAEQTMTFPAVAASTAGDYITIGDTNGLLWALSIDKTGADPEPTGAIWTAIPAGRKAHVDISGGTDAASVAALMETAAVALVGLTDVWAVSDAAANGELNFQAVDYGPTAEATEHNADDTGAGSITAVVDIVGAALEEPTGAIWTGTAAARRVLIDSTDLGVNTAAQMAAAAETALNTLTGFTAAITTDDTAANGTMTLTQVVRGPTTNPVPKNADDSGAGGITGVQTTAGVASNVDLTSNEITSGAHGMDTGLKIRLTTSSALPAGLAAATDYYVIAVDDDTFQLATSYANAFAGTDIDITDYGVGTHTIDTQEPSLTGTLKLQASNNCFADNVNGELRSDAVWVDIPSASATLDGGDDTVFFNITDANYEAVRLVWTRTAGQGSISTYILAKGDG